MKTLDIRSIQFDGINYKDAPDFCDAYICEASWEDGTDLTEDELDKLNEDSQFVYESLMDRIH